MPSVAVPIPGTKMRTYMYLLSPITHTHLQTNIQMWPVDVFHNLSLHPALSTLVAFACKRTRSSFFIYAHACDHQHVDSQCFSNTHPATPVCAVLKGLHGIQGYLLGCQTRARWLHGTPAGCAPPPSISSAPPPPGAAPAPSPFEAVRHSQHNQRRVRR